MQGYKSEKLLQEIKAVLRLKLPPPVVLMIIMELIEHGPNFISKLVK